jgi:hypothetical protein
MNNVEELLSAAEGVLAGIIAHGSGPAAPIFDEFDFEVERNRGSWCTVDGNAIDRLRAAVTAAKK